MKVMQHVFLSYLAKLLLVFTICMPLSDVFADCSYQRYTLIELMNTQDTSIHVFTGKIIRSMKADEYHSLMVVTSRIQGNPKDTVLLRTSFFVGVGVGPFLEKESEHLIVTTNKNNYYYSAYVCGYHSAPLTIINQDSYPTNYNLKGKERLRILKEYFDYKNNKYTGSTSFKIGEHVVATGTFDDGLATGEWRYFKMNRNKELNPFSIVHYNKGMLSGKYISYERDIRDVLMTSVEIYKEGTLQSQKIYGPNTYDPSSSQVLKTTEYITEDNLSTAVEKEYNENGLLAYEITTQTRTFPRHIKMTYLHGYYNLSAEYSEFLRGHGLNSTGQYYYGAKVGQWKYHSDDGTLVSYEDFDYPKSGIDSGLNAFHNNGKIRKSYVLDDNGNLTKVLEYNIEGQQTSVTLISENGSLHTKSSTKYGFKESSYRNNMPHGRQSYSRLDSTLSSETYYKDGMLHGPYRKYYTNGKLNIEKNYENGILIGEELIYSETGELLHKNFHDKYGSPQGACKYYNEGRLQYEGVCKDGFRVGRWTEYQLSENSKYSYIIHEYALLKEGQRPPTINGHLLTSVYYDENGKELKRKDY